ncbi:MAG: thymidylate synthase [Rhodobiaceae bacterium]|nr:thymidylate synthase [Rhodobiaceae bacterium]
MFITGETLDDVMLTVFERLIRSRNRVNPTKGDNRELFGVLLEIRQPRARLSRTETKGRLFSALGEFIWYLAGSDEFAFIDYYIKNGYQTDDGKSVFGAYGPRIFGLRGVDQFSEILQLLGRNSESRKAVLQLYSAEDLKFPPRDVPCTCTLQFVVRRKHLNLMVSMRSNDAYKGLPHDVFAFTMLQEIVARCLGVGLGNYKHSVGSLHLYDDDVRKAQDYISEGWQSALMMPPMPDGDPMDAVTKLVQAEEKIRRSEPVDVEQLPLPEYWKDMARLLQIFALTKGIAPLSMARKRKIVRIIKDNMSNKFYDGYIQLREQRLSPAEKPAQMRLGDPDEIR